MAVGDEDNDLCDVRSSNGLRRRLYSCVWDCMRLFVDETVREMLNRLGFSVRHQF